MLGDKHLILEPDKCVQSKPDDFWKLPVKSQNVTRLTFKNEEKSNKPKKTNFESAESSKNLEEERKLLNKIIKTSLSNLEEEDYCGSLECTVEKLDTAVSVMEVYRSEDLPVSFTYQAKVKCVICSKPLTITKQKRGEKGTRWIISNYVKHYGIHLKKKGDNKPVKRKSTVQGSAAKIARTTDVNGKSNTNEDSEPSSKKSQNSDDNSTVEILSDGSPTKSLPGISDLSFFMIQYVCYIYYLLNNY